MKVAVTGATGFIGSRLAEMIRLSGHELLAAGRQNMDSSYLTGASCVIHCAGLAHGRHTPQERDQVNNLLAVQCAAAAEAAGVRRFVLLSSINTVAGNQGRLGPAMPYAPVDALGQAKAKAEQTLLARPTGMEIVVARSTLVYGPGVRGNLRSLLRLLDSPWPLPLGENQRSMVSLTNLVSALIHLATTDQQVDRRIFHVTDGPLSTSSIAYWARLGMGRAPRTAMVLARPVQTLLRIAGRGKLADQLFGDLLVDGSALLNVGWIPAGTAAEHLMAMGREWRRSVSP